MNRSQVTAAAALLAIVGGAAAGWKARPPIGAVRASEADHPATGWKPVPLGQPTDAPKEGEPYVGISVRDTPDGVVVGWVYPGPAGGNGFGSTLGIKRGDNIDAVYGGNTISAEHRVDIESAQDFSDFIAALSAGETISIRARRSVEAVNDGSIPKGGPGGEVTTYSITVASREQWTGTIKRGLGERAIANATEGEFESLILGLAAEVGARDAQGGLNQLLAYFADVQETNLDPNSLPCVVQGFARPLSIDAVEAEVAALAKAAASGSLEDLHKLIANTLDLPQHDAAALDAAMEGVDLSQFRADLRGLVSWQLSELSVGGDRVESQIRAINTTQGLVGPFLASLMRDDEAIAAWEQTAGEFARANPPAGIAVDAHVDLPVRILVKAAVTGDIVRILALDDGSIGIVGGPGPNTYDMAIIANVYDIGGNDVYAFARNGDAPARGNHHIIDLAGDDLYEATTAFAGPGVGVMGLSVVDDRTGDDTYRSAEHFTIGAGLFGIGVLLDHAGNDRYENLGPGGGWSMGAGYYGAGLVIDRDGDDTYHGEQLTQGVGGPRGFGAIIDARGRDTYKANGPNFGSVYGTADVFKGFSQGFGIGVRGYAAGGLGAIYDLKGDDRYEAGEFSQGCAYYFAKGLLHDVAGNDTYVGNRYGQASAAHQAIGVLIDDAGDDSYWSMTAASQAGVWDQSLAVLIDRAGNDRYQADGLAQGSAAMQAIGILLDLGGDDSYLAKGGSQQGQGGSNTYHFDADGLFSFSALIDLGGGDDTYSSGRAGDSLVATGVRNDDSPAQSNLLGLFCDR